MVCLKAVNELLFVQNIAPNILSEQGQASVHFDRLTTQIH